MRVIITNDDNGKTVLDFLRYRLGLSGAFIRHLKFAENGIRVGGEHVTVRYSLKCGDCLELLCEDIAPSEKIVPNELDLEIAYEDDDVVIPNKPHDMPTHPSHNHHDDTVANALAYRYAKSNSPFVFRPVNRLDRNTSGLLIVARNRIAASKLFALMKQGDIQKEYIAVLCGTPAQDNGEIETYMRRTEQSIIVREVCDKQEGADHALTRYSMIATCGKYSVVRATPVTGRTHQLRVHFAHIGCPIVGDDLYGSDSPLISRHALHASRLVFPHPSTNERIDVRSPLPTDMIKLIDTVFDFETAEILKETLC